MYMRVLVSMVFYFDTRILNFHAFYDYQESLMVDSGGIDILMVLSRSNDENFAASRISTSKVYVLSGIYSVHLCSVKLA